MFLLHIQAEMVPTGTSPTNQRPVCFSHTSMLKWCLWRTSPTKPCPELSLWDVSLTHPGWNGDYRNISHKPVPSRLYTWCFTYTSRLKWCLWTILTNQCPSQYLLDASLTHPGWNGFYEGLPPTNPNTVYSVRDASLTHLGWNGA